jgi:hypothetical protein
MGKRLFYQSAMPPVRTQVNRRIVHLPSDQELRADQVIRVEAAMEEFFSARSGR